MRRLAGPMRLLTLGWYVALCITVGIVAGIWLDRTFGLLPLFTLLGLFLGLIAAFVGLYRMVSETVEADAQYTAEDDAAIAAWRARHPVTTDEERAETDEHEDWGTPPQGERGTTPQVETPETPRSAYGAGMNAWELEARMRQASEPPRPDGQEEEQR